MPTTFSIPGKTLHWPTVRVIRYRQHKPDGSVVQADWLLDFSSKAPGAEPFSLSHGEEPLGD